MSCPKCKKCPMPKKWGIPNFDPANAVEGDSKSAIWIVGLSPKTDESEHQLNSGSNPFTWANRFKAVNKVPHFLRLKSVLGDSWFKRLLQPDGIAHTDIVKCASPVGFGKEHKGAVAYCAEFLLHQIREHRPKLLLVLSSDASRLISKEAKFKADATEGHWKINGETCHVLLSGYTSDRQERYAKLRLQKDFLAACRKMRLT